MKSLYLLILSFFLVSNAHNEGIELKNLLDEYYIYPHTKIIDYIKPNYITACEILSEAIPIYYAIVNYHKTIAPTLIITCTDCNHPFFTLESFISALLSHCIEKLDNNNYSKHEMLSIIQRILATLNLQPEELLKQLTILTQETNYHCSICHKTTWQFTPINELIEKQTQTIDAKTPYIVIHCNYEILRGTCIFHFYEFLLKARINHESLHKTIGSIYCSHCKQSSFSYQDFTDEILLTTIKTSPQTEDEMGTLLMKLKHTMIGMAEAFSCSYNKTARALIHYARKNKFACSNCNKSSWQFIKKTGDQTLTNFPQEHPEQWGLIKKKNDYAKEIMQLKKEQEILKKKLEKQQNNKQKTRPVAQH